MSKITVVSDDMNGTTKIADEVITNITSSAVLEVDGVAGISRQFANDITGKFGRKKLQKGVTLEVKDGLVQISVAIVVRRDAKIPAVAQAAQAKIKTAVETMTGLTTGFIKIHIGGLAA